VFHTLVAAECEDLALAGRKLIEGLLQPEFILAGEQPVFHRVRFGVEQSGDLAAEPGFPGQLFQHVEYLVTGNGKEPVVEAEDVGDLVAMEPDLQEGFLNQFVRLGGIAGQVERKRVDLTTIMMENDAKGSSVTFCYTGQQFVLIRQR